MRISGAEPSCYTRFCNGGLTQEPYGIRLSGIFCGFLVVVYAPNLTPGTTFAFQKGSPDDRESPFLFPRKVMNSIQSASDKTVIELALVTVRASGDAQDHAAEIVSIAGGRLLSLDDHGFTAQVTNRPEAIDTMVGKLDRDALAAIVRSGGLSLNG